VELNRDSPSRAIAARTLSATDYRLAVRRTDFAVFEAVRRAGGVVHPVLAVSVGETADPIGAGMLLDCAQQFAERDLALAAHKIIDVDFLISFGRKG
jgi:selenocysteine lyase/cysteine desulfurase